MPSRRFPSLRHPHPRLRRSLTRRRRQDRPLVDSRLDRSADGDARHRTPGIFGSSWLVRSTASGRSVTVTHGLSTLTPGGFEAFTIALATSTDP
jgi:hypothetical protein